jgi:hypothetical protein
MNVSPKTLIRMAAVNEVLDLHAGPGPHAEDVLGPGPALALGMKSIPCCSTWNASSDPGREWLLGPLRLPPRCLPCHRLKMLRFPGHHVNRGRLRTDEDVARPTAGLKGGRRDGRCRLPRQPSPVWCPRTWPYLIRCTSLATATEGCRSSPCWLIRPPSSGTREHRENWCDGIGSRARSVPLL